MSLEQYFSTGPQRERPIFEAIMEHLESVGIFLKRGRTFAELRPMARWVALWFPHSSVIADRRIARRVTVSAGRTWYVVNLRTPDDVDDQVRSWLTEAYLNTPE